MQLCGIPIAVRASDGAGCAGGGKLFLPHGFTLIQGHRRNVCAVGEKNLVGSDDPGIHRGNIGGSSRTVQGGGVPVGAAAAHKAGDHLSEKMVSARQVILLTAVTLVFAVTVVTGITVYHITQEESRAYMRRPIRCGTRIPKRTMDRSCSKEQAFNRTKKRRTRSGRRRKMDTTTKGTRTKYRLAEAMKECMKTTPVDNITVTQLTELCGVTRQTFYRNFIDKYDLINWYFDILLHKSFEHMGRGKNIYESLVKKFSYIREERVFFSAGFKSADRNNLKDHDFEADSGVLRGLIRQKTGKMPDEEIGFLLEMYCQSSVYMTVKWVTEGSKMPPERLAELMVKAMPEKISELFEQLEILY